MARGSRYQGWAPVGLITSVHSAFYTVALVVLYIRPGWPGRGSGGLVICARLYCAGPLGFATLFCQNVRNVVAMVGPP